MMAEQKQVIPEGYKQTEVGLIPMDWELSTIGNVTFWMSGGTPSRKNSEFWTGSIPWISGSTLKTLELSTSDQFLTEQGVESGSKMAPLNATLLLVRGSALHTEIRAGLVVSPVCFNQDVKALVPNQSVYPKYLTIYLLAMESELLKLVSSAGNSAGVLDTQLVQGFKFLKPPLPEQTAIANALSDVDALIFELEKLIAKKQAIKTATMQQLLTGKTRLPQFALREDGTPKGYKASELGEIPEDWEVRKIGQFTDCTAGGTPSTSISSYWDGNNPWMSSGELHLKRVFDVAERITDDGLANSSTKYIPAESVLIGLAGQGKTRGTVAIAKISLCTNQSIAAIFPSDSYCTEYLYYNLDKRYEELRGLSTGDGGRGGLNLSIIRNLSLGFPDIKEQKVIAKTLTDMDEEIQTLQQRLHKTRQIKQGMMQELLTGKTRLVKPASKGE